MKPEEDRLEYLLHPGKRRKRSRDAKPRQISPIKPRNLVPRPYDDKPSAAGFTLSKLPFYRPVSKFALLELACLSGFIPEPPKRFKYDVELLARSRDFLRFTGDFGEPVLLLQLRNRYRGKIEEAPPPAGGEAVFVQFAEASRALESDKEVGALVARLREGPKSLDEAIAAFGDPEVLLSGFVRRKKKNPLDECIVGISKLRRFTASFDLLLTGLADQPAFARSLWSYHHFWLGKTAVRFDEVLERAGKEMTRWLKPDPDFARAAFLPGNPLAGAVASARRFETGAYFK